MTPELWKYIITQGVFCVLFVILLVYVFKQNEKRENRLMDFVEKVGPALEKVETKLCEIEHKLNNN